MAINMDKVRAAYSKLKNKGGGVYYKPNAGDLIRFLEMEGGEPAISHNLHYNMGKPFVCPREKGQVCYACDLGWEIRNNGTKEEQDMAGDLLPSQRYYSIVVKRGEEGSGAKIYSYGPTVYEDYLSVLLDDDYNDVTDVVKGHDFKVKQTPGTEKRYTKTSIQVRPKPTPLGESIDGKSLEDDTVKKLVNDHPVIADTLLYHTPAEVKTLVEGFIGVEDESPAPEQKEKSASEKSKDEIDNFLGE